MIVISSTVIVLCAQLLQSCLILCDAMDFSPPSSSVHGIFQARVLEWGAIAFSPLQSKGLSKVFSNTTVQKRQFFGTQLSL